MMTKPDAAGMWPPNPFSWWPVIVAVCIFIAVCFFPGGK